MKHTSEAKFIADTTDQCADSDDKRSVFLAYLSTLAFNISALWTKSIDASRSRTQKVPTLNAHIRRDVGIEDGPNKVRTNWNDPLEIEIRRLRNRL